LVLAAVALPVPGGAEDLLAEEPVLLRLEGAVVDGIRLLEPAVGCGDDVLRGSQTDPELVEHVDVEQLVSLLPSTCGRGWSLRGWRSVPPRRRLTGAGASLRSPRRCSRRGDGTGRYRAPRLPGTPPRRCRASRSRCRRRRAPRRSGRATASP